MTTLKEINGNSYLKCEAKISQTRDESKIGFLTKAGFERNDLTHFRMPMPIILDSINVHIDIIHLTKDLNVNDIIMHSGVPVIITHMDYMFLTLSDNQMVARNIPREKLIATTRKTTLKTNKISASFIDKYCINYKNDNVIKNVFVEYVEDKPKLNKKNEVSIIKYKNERSKEVDGHIYSVDSFPEYKMRYIFGFSRLNEETELYETTNVTIYSTNTNVIKVCALIDDRINNNHNWQNAHLVHKSTRESDDNASKFLDSFFINL